MCVAVTQSGIPYFLVLSLTNLMYSPVVPESILKKRKAVEELRAKRSEELAAERKVRCSSRQSM